jgi:glutamine amidotransferase-like uncharacterized protein
MSQEFDIGDWVYIDKEKQKYGQIIDEYDELYKIKATLCVKIDEKTCKLETFHPNYNTKWLDRTQQTHMIVHKETTKKTKGRTIKCSRG